jgi:Exocyst complex component Sec3
MLSAWDGNCRKLVDKSYARIVKSIFESLESEAQSEQDSKSGDEKDSLNKHIMIVGNF